MSENIDVWRKIKSGDTLTLGIDGKTASDQNLVAVVRVLPTSGRELQWLDHQVHPGPKTLTVSANTAYSVRIGVKFLGPSTETAVIAAVLRNAAGNVRKDIQGNTAYSHEVKGKAGSPLRRATLMLLTN